jgi:hypothetical protein
MNLSPIRLIVTDVDGTLLPKSRTLSERTSNVIRQLQARQIPLVLASSRPPRGMQHIMEEAGLNDARLPLISLNGALVSTLGGTVLAETLLESHQMLGMMACLRDLLGLNLLNVMLLDAERWWVASHDDGSDEYDEFVQREAWSLRMKPLVGWGNDGGNNIHQRMLFPAHKITLLGQPERVAEAKTRLVELYATQITATSPANPKFLDITAANVHKGTAIERLAATLGIQRQEICVLGDGENDVEMFRAVGGGGVSVAMGNASDAVKAAARFVTGSPDEDGWAKAVEQYVLA